jgi:hypothetical protein
VFPTGHVPAKKESDLARFERQKARAEVVKSQVCQEQVQVEDQDPDDVRHDFDAAEYDEMLPIYLDAGTQTRKSSKTVGTQSTRQFHVDSETNTDICQPVSQYACLPFLQFPDKQFISFTGVGKTLFQFLAYRIGTNLTDSRNMSRELKIVLVLVKLKLSTNYVNLAGFFDIDRHFAKKVFVEALNALRECAQKFVIWFTRDTIRARLPASFKGLFPATRAIIDASEVECATTTCPTKNVKMYSHYKARMTIKFLVACAPSGEITFISKAFGGRTTDTEITVKSGFVDLVEPGDLIMADKGFPSIETSLVEAGGILVMPPFKKGQKNFQFSSVQNDNAYKIASVRIHVERAIQRMKRFQILDYVKADMIEHIDDILVIVSGICNLSTDLIHQ